MKDEIKKIITEMQLRNGRYIMCKNEDISFSDEDYKAHILLDYITNLQKEKDMYKTSFEVMSKNYFEEEKRIEQASLDTINNLQEEIHKKEAMYDSLAVDYKLSQEENEKLLKKSYSDDVRITKAIEYMNNYNELVVPDANIKSLILKEEYKKIINLLQGKSDE